MNVPAIRTSKCSDMGRFLLKKAESKVKCAHHEVITYKSKGQEKKIWSTHHVEI